MRLQLHRNVIERGVHAGAIILFRRRQVPPVQKSLAEDGAAEQPMDIGAEHTPVGAVCSVGARAIQLREGTAAIGTGALPPMHFIAGEWGADRTSRTLRSAERRVGTGSVS